MYGYIRRKKGDAIETKKVNCCVYLNLKMHLEVESFQKTLREASIIIYLIINFYFYENFYNCDTHGYKLAALNNLQR